ncbi:MAG: hypothetical protein RLZZ297_1240 [Chloroflexota bacterium]
MQPTTVVQQPTTTQLIVMVVVVIVLVMMRRKAVELGQPNRANAFIAALVAAVVLGINTAVRLAGIDIEAYQSSVAIVAFAPIAIAAYFLIQAALKGEANRIAPEVQRQADAFKQPKQPPQERDDSTPDA